MPKVLTVDLRGQVQGGASLEFLRAEMNGEMATPFALIRYAIDGAEQPRGLRIDQDKRVIFDRLGEPARDAVIERAAPQIADILAPVANERDFLLRATGPLAGKDLDALVVLWLSYKGHRFEEILERSGLSEATVSEIQQTALEQLAEILRPTREGSTQNKLRERCIEI